MSVELGTGYISIVPETKGFNRAVGSALAGVQGEGDKAGQGLGSRLAGGIGKTLKGGVIGVGVAAGAALGVSLTKGMGRLTGIENAEAKLTGLGHSAKNVDAIMGNALASVKGTAFGLQDAATVAAGAVAAGVKPGQDLERTLKLTGDAATIAGVSISEMGQVFGKVAASNKVQGDVINQLNDKGVPIVQLLGKTLGKTADEVLDLSKKGQIGFAEFQDAMESGLGGAALKSGETFTGALANMGAAAGRLGATLLGPLFNQAKSAFGGITDAVDGLNDRVKPLVATFDGWLNGTAIPKLSELGTTALAAFQDFRESDLAISSMARLGTVMESLVGSAQELWPAGKKIAGSLAEASAAIGISSWELLLRSLELTAQVADTVLVPAMDTLGSLMENNQGVVVGLAAGFLLLKTVPALLGRVAGAFAPMTTAVAGARTSMATFAGQMQTQRILASQVGVELSRTGAVIATMQARVPIIGQMGEAFRHTAGGATMLARTQGAASAAMTGLKAAGSGLAGMLGGPLGIGLMAATVGIMSVSTASSSAKAYTQALSDETTKLGAAQDELAVALRATGGAFDESVTPALVKNIETLREVESAYANIDTGFMAKLGTSFSNMGRVLMATHETIGDAFREGDKKFNAIDVADARKKSAEELDGVIRRLGMSNDDLAASVYGSEGAWTHLQDRLMALGPEGVAVQNKLADLRGAYEQLQKVMRDTTPGANDLGEAMGVLASKSSTASDKASALRRALQSLGILETDAESALFDLAEAVDEVAESLGEGVDKAAGFGSALLDGMGNLDAAVPNARAFRDELRELGDEYQNAISGGMDANEAWAMVGPSIEGLGNKYGVFGDQLEAVATKQGLVKPELVAKVSLEGASQAVVELTNVGIQLEAAQKRGEDGIQLRVQDKGAIEALRETGLAVTELSGTDHEVKISVPTGPMTTAFDAVMAKAAEIDAIEAEPEVLLNDSRFVVKDAETRAKLEELNKTEVSAEVDAIIDGLLDGTGISMEKLSKIDKTTAKPEVIAIIDEAMRRAEIVNAELDKAARDRNATIRVQYWESRGMSANTQGPVPVAGLASGGRLPTTGPGTNRVDGILGVNRDGAAVARVDAGEWVVNRRSSDKHDALLGAINRDDPALADLPAFADGGRIRDLIDGRSGGASRPLDGATYVWGGTNWGDCSGAMSAPARAAVGLDPFGGRFATGNQGQYLADLGYSSGRGGPGDLRFGWYNGGPQGGHTAGTLPDGTNIEMGGGYGGGKVGGSVGADSPQFTNHAYLTIGDSGPALKGWEDLDNERRGGYGDFSTGEYSSSSASGSESVTRMKTASELMKDGAGILVDGFFETLGLSGTALTDPSKLIGNDGSNVRVTESVPRAPSAQAQPRGSQVQEPVSATPQQIAQDSGMVYDPAKGAGQWDPVILEALGRVAGSPANLGRTREQIGIESAGDPDAVNNSDSNAAAGDPTVGLLQVKGSTFAHYRDPELPDDRRNPLANITSALRYVDDVYGAPEKIWPTVKGYRDGGKVTGGRGGIDDIFARLTADEFVVRAERARANMPALEAINAGADVSIGGGGGDTYAPVFQGIGTEEVFKLFEQWMRANDRRGVRPKTSRRR